MEAVTVKQEFGKRDFLGFSPLDGSKIIELFDYSLFIKKNESKALRAFCHCAIKR